MSVSALVLAAVVLADAEPLPWRHTLFVQFQGASLTWVPSPDDENAALGRSFLAKFEGTELPPYDGDAMDRAAVLEAVRAHLAGVGVRVVDERPQPWVPYTMAVVGGQWDDTAVTSVVRGSAPNVDCERFNPRHIVFAFVGSDEPTVQQATTVSQEAGHAWGLDHVLGEGLVMSYDFAALVSGFSDGCAPLCEEACQGPGSVHCQDVHAQFCGAGMQDSVAELMHTFGSDEPDGQPPSVEFLAPADGAVLAPGSDLEVSVVVTDNYGGVGWHFMLLRDGVEVAAQTAFDRETLWPLATLPEGSYEVRVIAEDHADNVTTAAVFIEVGELAASTGEPAADGGSGSDDGDKTTSTGDDAATSTGATTGDSAATDAGNDGCACTLHPRQAPQPTPGALALLSLLLLVTPRAPRGQKRQERS
ncbi:MAG: hypothetical protein JKY37_05255 [Nannocystaceae bacterium]|nr:hypothetical protein [Nannocystaceae bacterium]